jgi:ATP-dependent DNA helicase RecQ
MRSIYGIGEAKLRDLGQAFLDVIAAHCDEFGLKADVAPPPQPAASLFEKSAEPAPLTPRQMELFALFRQGLSLEEVARRAGLARSTLGDYLAAYIRHERPDSIAAWVDETTYHRVLGAARQTGGTRLKPIFLALGEAVGYETIRLVVAHAAGQEGVG